MGRKAARSLVAELIILGPLAGALLLAYFLAKHSPQNIITVLAAFTCGAMWAMLAFAIRGLRDDRHKVTVKRSCTADFTRWSLMLSAFCLGLDQGVKAPASEIMEICQSKQCAFFKKCRLVSLAGKCGFVLEFV